MSVEVDEKFLSLDLTTLYVEALDGLVEEGIYLNHQDAIRDALMRLFRYYGIEPFSEKEPAAPS